MRAPMTLPCACIQGTIGIRALRVGQVRRRRPCRPHSSEGHLLTLPCFTYLVSYLLTYLLRCDVDLVVRTALRALEEDEPDYLKLGPVTSGHVQSSQGKSRHVKTRHVRSGQVASGRPTSREEDEPGSLPGGAHSVVAHRAQRGANLQRCEPLERCEPVLAQRGGSLRGGWVHGGGSHGVKNGGKRGVNSSSVGLTKRKGPQGLHGPRHGGKRGANSTGVGLTKHAAKRKGPASHGTGRGDGQARSSPVKAGLLSRWRERWRTSRALWGPSGEPLGGGGARRGGGGQALQTWRPEWR